MTSKLSALLVTIILFQSFTNGQQTYRVDTSKSTVIWNSGEVGHHFGYIKFSSGSLLFSKDGKPVGGTFVIDMKTIKSQDNKDEAKNLTTDATMAKPDFFDIPKYPEAWMIVTEIEKVPNSAYHKVKGNLTIKGITHTIIFTAAILRTANEVNIRADIDVLRQWWGIDFKPKAPSTDFLTGVPQRQPTDQIFIGLKMVLTK